MKLYVSYKLRYHNNDDKRYYFCSDFDIVGVTLKLPNSIYSVDVLTKEKIRPGDHVYVLIAKYEHHVYKCDSFHLCSVSLVEPNVETLNSIQLDKKQIFNIAGRFTKFLIHQKIVERELK